jgi:hypothetical protein
LELELLSVLGSQIAMGAEELSKKVTVILTD